MLIREHAKKYIESGLVPIPLSREGDGKGTNIEGWPNIYFEANQFGEHNNIGLNLLLSLLRHLDWDSHNALIFASKFCKPTLEGGIIHPDTKKLIVTHFYYLKEGSSGDEFVKRNYPNGKTIAEFRVEGNAVVEPSIAETKLFDNKKVARQWNKQGKPIAVSDPDLLKNFNKVCLAAVLKDVIKSFNMPVVKLVSCLKRYCQPESWIGLPSYWSDEEISYFVETVVDAIPDDGIKDRITERKKVKSKIKSIIKNWDTEDKKAAGFQSFATHVGLTEKYCRDMFCWVGEIPKEGTVDDRKTIIDFTAGAMSEDDFHKEVHRSYLAAPLICDVGLYILAGRPKQGKSRLVKDLSYKVQNGGMWLGHTVTQGDVLLLALEDNADSMNIDIKAMGLQNKKKPITFVEQCPSLERGFIESVKLWHEKTNNPKLVVVDTFQKIKPMGSQKTKNANAYEVDYHYLSQLHILAKELKLCIIYIHHLSQADRSHSWDKIMGSTGHQGVTDAMYMLEREEVGNKGTFKGLGRNIAGFEMDIEWNTNPKEPMTFQYVGDSFEIKTKENKREIFKAMKQLATDGETEVKPVDVYKVLNLVSNKEKGSCNKNMQRMRTRNELLEGSKYGTYKLAHPLNHYDDQGNIIVDSNF
ncbi:AAA family ATPase [Candidatus Pelagibacter sp.]|nr:AAA family ATPase [Candidatus Pelagibacter sp.]